VYAVYRVPAYPGIEESPNDKAAMTKSGATIARGVLLLPRLLPPHTSLLSTDGREVLDLQPGANDVRTLAPGVYFVRSEPSAVSREPSAVVTKVVIQR